MRNTFKEFARLKTEELQYLWDNATIIFDTNILLNLYSYSENTRDGVFDIMNKLKSQLWLPYKVCEEFYTRRISVMHTANTDNNKIISNIEALLSIDKESCLYELLHDNKKLKAIKNDASKILKKNVFSTVNDTIVDNIEKIYEARVGQEPEQSEKESIDKEYQYRIENNIYCPGFKDSGKESNSSGDFHLWKQILKYATQNDKSVIFVTEDGKEDWWWKPQGERIGARYELLKEFLKQTKGQRFYICKFKDFTDGFAKYKRERVDKKIVKEIQDSEKNKQLDSSALAKLLSDVNLANTSAISMFKENTSLKELEKIRETYEKICKPYIDLQKKYNNLFKPYTDCWDKITQATVPLRHFQNFTSKIPNCTDNQLTENLDNTICPVEN